MQAISSRTPAVSGGVGCRIHPGGEVRCAGADPSASAYARGMVGSWDVEGELAMTEHWRSVVPDFTVDLAEDQTDIANDRRRVEQVRQRFALELKHLGGPKRSGMTSLTRISDWVRLTPDERQAPRPSVPFALCRGVASVLVEPAPGRLEDGLDYAIRVQVGPGLLPAGRCCLMASRWSSTPALRTDRSRLTPTSSGLSSSPSRHIATDGG